MARSTHPTSSFNAKSSIGTPRHRKRRRTDITVENQSPISDHSMNTSSGDVGEGNAGRLTRMGMRGDGLGRRTSQNSQEPRPSLLPTPGTSSTNLLPLVPKRNQRLRLVTPRSLPSRWPRMWGQLLNNFTLPIHYFVHDQNLVVSSYAPKRRRKLS